MSREEKKKLRHSLAECQLSDSALLFSSIGHAPLAPAEEDDDVEEEAEAEADEGEGETEEGEDDEEYTVFSQLSSNSAEFDEQSLLQSAAIMPHFALSWNVQYIGSFPISNVSAEHIGPRMDRFKPASAPHNVELSISLLGVRVRCEQTVLMSHSLRRVSNVVGRAGTNQVAYIALEPAGRTYRRLCHVFEACDAKKAEEIENVLGQAFTAQTLTAFKKSTTTNGTINLASNPMSSGTMHEKRSASTVFLNKFLGKKGSQTVDETAGKRKRRPVSAVFSSAIHRLSNSTTTMNPKRMTITEEQIGAALPRGIGGGSSMPSSSGSSSASSSSSDIENRVAKSPSSLVYDEKLGEWIVPIDDSTTQQLEHCNYFVGLPSREQLARNLLSQRDGAFVIRYSESKRKCLALSMRVPITHNPSGISHYLIIRNEHGYRLKLAGSNKPFPSLQMLLTHHSVLEGHLPCTLYFVQWDKNMWKPPVAAERSAIRNAQNRHSSALTKIDENRNLTSSTPTPIAAISRRCAIDEFSTPRRHSRHDLSHIRRSQFFDLEDRRVIS